MVSPRFETSAPYNPLAVLRISGTSGIPVEQIQLFLSVLTTAYNSILLFDSITWHLSETLDRFGIPPEIRYRQRRMLRGDFFSDIDLYFPIYGLGHFNPNDMVPADSELLFKGATFNSPGIWEFLGKINPLEVLRLYLNDRHERRKDGLYREAHENEKLRLENELLKNEIFSGRLNLLREMGVTQEELSALKNRLLHGPLDAVGSVQDRGLIATAEFAPPGSDPRQEPRFP